MRAHFIPGDCSGKHSIIHNTTGSNKQILGNNKRTFTMRNNNYQYLPNSEDDIKISELYKMQSENVSAQLIDPSTTDSVAA